MAQSVPGIGCAPAKWFVCAGVGALARQGLCLGVECSMHSVEVLYGNQEWSGE